MSHTSQSLYDRHITIFSPEGKLYQVEYAFRAVKGSSLTALALKGQDCAVVVCQKKLATQQQNQQDKLLDASHVTNIYKLSEHIGGSFVGIPGDCRAIVFRARQTAADFSFEKGYSIPVHFLSQKIANLNQIYTQHAYMRLHACTGILIGIDEETGPAVFRFDPAGWYASYTGIAAGQKEQEATSSLEKVVKKRTRETTEETIQAAVGCLQTVLGVDFKPPDIEVGLVTKDNPKFRLLTEAEIEEHLTAIAERD